MAAYNGAVLTIVGPKGATRTVGATATPSLFQVLGATPLLGRLFTKRDLAMGRDQSGSLRDRLWRSAFDGDPHAIGQTIAVRSLLGRARPPESYTIIGVMPAGFHFLDPDTQSQLWIPYPV